MTVTPSGEISWRGYGYTSAPADEERARVGSMKVGNVGDWDLSRLEDETLVTGGTDGIVSRAAIYSVLLLANKCLVLTAGFL